MAIFISRRAMEKVFKGYFLDRLKALHQTQKLRNEDEAAFEKILQEVKYIKWNVYAKRPFGGPQQVLEYLGRYTHKVAITSHRILSIDDTTITFKYKDYKDGNKQKQMTLSQEEFLRRFEQHILPKGFVKIRHSGFLSHQHKTERLQSICKQLDIAAPAPKVKLPRSYTSSHEIWRGYYPVQCLQNRKTGAGSYLCQYRTSGRLSGGCG